MGGGAGVSAHGRFRVATEHAMFAMPETQIGLFPDVGAAHFLRNMPRRSGTYVGLTGARLSAADLLYSGLATHFVPRAGLDDLLARLQALPPSEEDVEQFDAAVSKAIEDAAAAAAAPSLPPSALEANADEIERAFEKPTVEAIVSELEAVGSQFADDTLRTLSKMSPTSLKVTLEHLRRGRHHDLDATLRTDFRIVARMTDPDGTSDFFEGVRALLVDKDRNPQWRRTLDQLSPADVDAFFAPLPPPLADLDLNP
mmetsp:Transcript_7655/g.23655  ORF Transcript_7655/g.23655 Transcript_7655/m.23655 type:complete len:256 (+) Transcript_7655:25-792(+)